VNSTPDRNPNEAAVQAIAAAYYAKEVGAAEIARERAQRSYTIAGAIGTTLLAAGVFTDIATQSTILKLLGIATLVAWLVVAVLYTRPIASPIQRLEPASRQDPTAFVTTALASARQERDSIDGLLRTAQWGGLVAATLTIATLLAAFFLPKETFKATIALSERGQAAAARVCPRQIVGGDLLNVELEKDSVSKSFVMVHLPPGRCSVEETKLQLPKGDVLAINP
jgi:hypothetical protein